MISETSRLIVEVECASKDAAVGDDIDTAVKLCKYGGDGDEPLGGVSGGVPGYLCDPVFCPPRPSWPVISMWDGSCWLPEIEYVAWGTVNSDDTWVIGLVQAIVLAQISPRLIGAGGWCSVIGGIRLCSCCEQSLSLPWGLLCGLRILVSNLLVLGWPIPSKAASADMIKCAAVWPDPLFTPPLTAICANGSRLKSSMLYRLLVSCWDWLLFCCWTDGITTLCSIAFLSAVAAASSSLCCWFCNCCCWSATTIAWLLTGLLVSLGSVWTWWLASFCDSTPQWTDSTLWSTKKTAWLGNFLLQTHTHRKSCWFFKLLFVRILLSQQLVIYTSAVLECQDRLE